MIKKNFLLVAILVLPLFMSAQTIKTSKEFTLDVSKPYTVVDGSKKWYFVHEEQMLAIKFRGTLTFQLFDLTTLTEKNKTVLSKKTGGMPKGFVQEEFIQLGNRIYQFYNVWDKPNKTEQIFVKELAFEKPDQSGKGKLIFSLKGKLKSLMGQNKIDVYQSFDKSKILVAYQRKKTERKDALNFETHGMIVFDNDMEELWRKEVKMPYSEKEMENMGYTLDNNGNVYLLIRKKSKKDKNPIELMKISDSEVKTIKIEAGGKYFPRGIKLQEGKNNNIFCAGYYGGRIASQGIYIAILNSDGELEDEKFHEIPLKIINQNKSDRAQERSTKKEAAGKDIGINHLTLDQIKVNPDGSLILIGEVFYVVTMSNSDGATNTYYYKEIMAVKVAADGSLLWMNKLVKNQTRKQSFRGSYGTIVIARLAARKEPRHDLSYQYINSATNHYFLYLDNLKNLNLPQNKYPARHMSRAGGFLTAYQINDDTGEVTKLSLFDLRKLKGIPVFQFNTDRIVQKSEDEILIELYKKGKEDILLRIKISD